MLGFLYQLCQRGSPGRYGIGCAGPAVCYAMREDAVLRASDGWRRKDCSGTERSSYDRGVAAVCDQRTAEDNAGPGSGVQCLGRATAAIAFTSWQMPVRRSRRPTATCRRDRETCAAPNPRIRTGRFGASAHVLRVLGGLSSGFPFARRVRSLRPPLLWFPSSGVLPLVAFVRRCRVRSLRPRPVPVPRRFPSGFPFT